jgi:hypothetical protein
MLLRFAFLLSLASSAFAAIPFIPMTSVKVLPQLAYGGGWSTTIYLTNPNSYSASATIDFYSADGKALAIPTGLLSRASTMTLTLPARSTKSVTVDYFLNIGGTNALVQGWAKLTLDLGVTGYAIFRQSVSGYNDQEAVINFASINSTSSVLLYDDTHYTTTLAILNPTSAASTIHIDTYLEDGTASTSSIFGLGALSRGAYVLTNLIPALKGHKGQIVVSTSNATGVSVLGLRFNGLAFTSILPAEQ